MSEEKRPGLSLASDTLIITAVGAVLYFWGIIYYMQLTESLGLEISLFSIPVYDVLIAPWDSAVITLIFASTLWVLWHQRLCFRLMFFLAASATIGGAFYTIKKIPKPLIVIKWGQKIKIFSIKFFARLKETVPASLIDEMDSAHDKRMLLAIFHSGIVVSAVWIGIGMSPKAAIKWVKNYNASTKTTVELLCQDNSLIKGNYVRAIGDCIIVDVINVSQLQRVLVKNSEIKRLTKFLSTPAVITNPPSATPLSNLP